ncbi:MAG: DNA-binding domain-containing protein [Gammaproteobacteria bacterium]|nr:DNA-binding domain-containing protein [Gammaproteobacteria bacterium]
MWQSRLVTSLLQQATLEQKLNKSISGSLAAESLLQIYRNNYFNCMQEALQATFKKTELMLGSEFFHYIGHEFILNKPFQETSLLHFGSEFSDYLATNDAMANLQYVADLAALEWAMEEIYNTQTPRLDKGDGYHLNSALQLVSSKFALFDIWQYVSALDDQQGLDVAHAAQWVLVTWVDGDIRLQSFDVEQGKLLQAILEANLPEQQLALSQLPATTTNWLLTIGVLV